METRQRPSRALFWIGVIGLILVSAYAVWWGPNNLAARLERQVEKAADEALKNGGHAWAQARVHGQRVDLAGSAPNASELAAAQKAVLTSLGEGGVFQGGVTKVTTHGVALAAEGPAFVWAALKEGGPLRLEGKVDSRASEIAIEKSARLWFGQTESRMEVAAGAPKGVNWRLGATRGLEALNKLDRGFARLEDRRLIVSGFAKRDEDIPDLAKLLEPAQREGFEVAIEVQGPALWTARLGDGGRIAFAGKAPSEAAKAELVALARRTASAVEDQMIVAAGEADWAPRAAAALPAFLQLKRGEMQVQGKVFRISGEGPGSAIAYLKEDMDRMSDGYKVMYALTELAPEVAEIADVNLDVAGAEKAASCQTAFDRVMGANTILFDTGRATISRQSGETLDKIIEVARRCNEFAIRVEGHTDAVGSRALNLRLSRDRAQAVLSYMTERGIAADKLAFAGYGSSRPLNRNRTEAERALNRRIEFQVSAEQN